MAEQVRNVEMLGQVPLPFVHVDPCTGQRYIGIPIGGCGCGCHDLSQTHQQVYLRAQEEGVNNGVVTQELREGRINNEENPIIGDNGVVAQPPAPFSIPENPPAVANAIITVPRLVEQQQPAIAIATPWCRLLHPYYMFAYFNTHRNPVYHYCLPLSFNYFSYDHQNIPLNRNRLPVTLFDHLLLLDLLNDIASDDNGLTPYLVPRHFMFTIDSDYHVPYYEFHANNLNIPSLTYLSHITPMYSQDTLLEVLNRLFLGTILFDTEMNIHVYYNSQPELFTITHPRNSLDFSLFANNHLFTGMSLMNVTIKLVQFQNQIFWLIISEGQVRNRILHISVAITTPTGFYPSMEGCPIGRWARYLPSIFGMYVNNGQGQSVYVQNIEIGYDRHSYFNAIEIYRDVFQGGIFSPVSFYAHLTRLKNTPMDHEDYLPLRRTIKAFVSGLVIKLNDSNIHACFHRYTYFQDENGAKPKGPTNLCNLLIYYLPEILTEHHLCSIFSLFGIVVSATVIMDRKSKKSKGYGFVSFGDENSAIVARQIMDVYRFGNHNKILLVRFKNEEIIEIPQLIRSVINTL